LASLFADPIELQTFCLEADVDHKSEKWVALTEEMIRRRTEKSEYIRLHISDEQYNQNKTTTGQEDTSCLANTQDGLQNQPNRKTDSSIIFIRKPEGTTITFPHGMEIPIRKTVAPLLHPTVTKCSVMGCLSDKKYSCSLTKVPLCSLSCYKKNLEKYNSVTKL
jgi:INO80 complex subunit B